MNCMIIHEEIDGEECACVQAECYAKRPGKSLEKKFKRIIGWNIICKNCKYHQTVKKK